jgi:RND family efflux transporter MFP subunit
MKTNNLYKLAAFLLVPALAITLDACTDGKSEQTSIPKTSEPIPVKVMPLQKSKSTNVIEVSGKLTTDDETVLSFKTAGVVHSILVKEGDRVRKGQVLAILDLTEIKAGVSQAQLAFEKAKRDLQRMKNLYQDSVATLEQLQNTQTALDIAQEQLNAALFNKSFSEIHSPANGIVLQKFVNAGQVVGIGDPVLMTNGAATGQWNFKAGVSDKQWASIKVGDKASIQIDAFPGKTFSASVVRKSGKSDNQTGAFTIELQLQAKESTIASGMFGKALIETGDSHHGWAVPYEAILDANDDEGFVFVTFDNKTAAKRPVRISSFNNQEVLISEGLEDVASLVVSGSAYLTDKAPIYIVK